MRIADVKTYVVANPPPHKGGAYFVFLKLTTDDNVEGFGEVYGVPFHPDKVTRLIEDVVERYREVGVNEFILDQPEPAQFPMLERIAGEVMPRLRRG